MFKGEVSIQNGIIDSIEEKPCTENHFILPGFIDAHVHIESSMLVPTEFARIAVSHGTVATVSDPHEIANVLGVKGVEFMIENGKQSPFKFNFGAPSCVPATAFETAGAVIDAEEIKSLMANSDIKYLAEFMNYPGVIHKDEEALKKIAWAKHYNKPIDGHAPGLRGDALTRYIDAGITTDHECFSYEEGLEKLNKGMKVLIREGSAAKNFDALIGLLNTYYEQMMFCSDDKHPDDLLIGHINTLCARAVSNGIDIFKILQMACVNPVTHYNLDVGLLRVGDHADCIIVEDLKGLQVLQTYIDGQLVFDKGLTHIEPVKIPEVNNFNTDLKIPEEFKVAPESEYIRVIECQDGELITKETIEPATIVNGNLVSNTERDVLKITVVNRYQNEKPSIGFIKNFGLKEGAIASSVAHDSHNIIAVGVSDEALCQAVNLVIKQKGGICALRHNYHKLLPLPIAGIMSDKDARNVGKQYAKLDAMAKDMGSTLKAPYMTLSFMALLVIPALKLSDKGVFDGRSFTFKKLQVNHAGSSI